MAERAFRYEDIVGLLVALVLHVALAVALVFQMFFVPDPYVPPQRVTVSLAAEVSLQSTAPDPVPESRAAIAPSLADVPAPPVQEAPAAAAPETRPAAPPAPTRPASRPERRTPFPDTERVRPDRQPERPRTPARTAPRQPARAANTPAGGSRIGDNFLEGQGSSTRTEETRAPAATFGRAEQAALSSAITRQLRPHWSAPSGADAELLESVVSWQLNSDGSLKGRPTCRNVASSVTNSNRPQAQLHCERAIRAVQLAAPFNLPEQFYSRWKDLEWGFNRRL